MANLQVHSKELSSLNDMDLLFENYCKDNQIQLDFSKSSCCNAYLDESTGDKFVWFIKGILFSLIDRGATK